MINLFLMPQEIVLLLLIFCRVGTMIMVLPIFGDMQIIMRVRLLFAVLCTMIIAPLVRDRILSDYNYSDSQTLFYVIFECLSGICIGLCVRLFLSAISVLGGVASLTSSLGAASMFDPSQGQSAPIYSRFFYAVFIALILATNMHFIFIKCIIQSYEKFSFGDFAKYSEDYIHLIIRTICDVFNIGIRLASPFIATTLLLNIGAGILARFMPQFQIFFLMLPVQVMVGIVICTFVISGAMIWALEDFTRHLQNNILP